MVTDFVDILKDINKERSFDELGDRSKYIGSSDVSGCPRRTVLSKLNNVEHDTETVIRFERGKIAELMFEPVFKKLIELKDIVDFRSQFDISYADNEHFKAHIDFLIKNTDNSFTIVEMKTVSNIPEKPYDSWMNQVCWQLGLLKSRYPNVSVFGSILILDLNTGLYKYHSSIEFNKYLFDNALKPKAELILKSLETGELPDCEPDGLCAYCPFTKDCPAMQPNDKEYLIVNDADLEQQIAELKSKQDYAKELDKEIKQLSNIVKPIAAKLGKFNVGRYYVSAKTYTTNKFDAEAFKKSDPDGYKKYLKELEQVRLTIKEVK
jgi:hypothetical protein